MVDFTDCEINNFKFYGGKNGGKKCVIYNGEDYMLKFPTINKGISNHEYSNSCISEYISCNILKSMGLNVQDTILGKYTSNNTEKIVVACKDFAVNGNVLKQFAELKNSLIDTSENGYGTELIEVIEAMDEQKIIDSVELTNFFWDMFIADAFIGNFDRHNGNWGFLVNENLKKIEIAPIYDCASCLYPQLTDERISEIINDDTEMMSRVFVFPTSSLKIDGKKINYFKFISSFQEENCNRSLLRVFPNINFDKINSIIDETPFISELRKSFYKKILQLRYDEILKVNYKTLTAT